MLFAFDFTSWYATLIYVVGGFLVLVAAAEKLYGWSGWVRDRNAPPEGDVGGDTDPYVVIGHPGGEQSVTPAHELAEDEKRSLTRVAPRYLIENKDVNGIRDVTTGVRARDGREHRFEDFFAGLIGPGEQAEVAVGGSIPQELISGVHESEAFTAFLYWARFRRDAVRWEVVYDPRTRRNTYAQLPAVQPQLNARVRQVGESGFVIDVTNTGNVAIDSVEVELPDGAENWQLITEALSSYPIRLLEPGDSQAIIVVVTMGGPPAVDAIVRGRVDGVPYERHRNLSLIG